MKTSLGSTTLTPHTSHLTPPRRILVIGLSNVGDAILMSPVIAQLHSRFPQASLTLLVGERARPLFVNDPRVTRVVSMEEFSGLWGSLRLVEVVWRARPNLLVDLRQTILPLVVRPWRAFSYFWPVPQAATHMRTRHLWRLHRQLGHRATGPLGHSTDGQTSLWIAEHARAAMAQWLRRWEVDDTKRLVVISPGARSHIKRWLPDRFATVADRLIEEDGAEVILTGESDENAIVTQVLEAMRHRAHNAVGSTTILQLGALMHRASLVITNDSASLHLACEVGVPCLALFGPTDPRKYGPTGPSDRVIQRRLFCVPCEQALCRFNHECMRFISVDEIYGAARQMLAGGTGDRRQETGDRRQGTGVICHSSFDIRHSPKRILVMRLDRIGDVVLSTPVLEELRKAYPQAYIAMMVRPVCRELVEGNPYLNEVILYDKDGRHKGIFSTIRFAHGLRRSRFDTALVLHPSNRSHWIPALVGIPVRIGYDRRSSWLLTHRVPHCKQEGKRHEAEYTLEFLRVLGIEASNPKPFVPINPEIDKRIGQLLSAQGIAPQRALVAIHPSASDESKRWPPERFAQVADRLIDEHDAQIVLVAGSGHEPYTQAVQQAMRHQPVNLAGNLSVGALAALFARCRLLISNDSGPVHIAAAVGTPVVALFGRNQPGLSARRWRPLGPDHVVLQKEDTPNFTYIAEHTVEEVYHAAARFLPVLARPLG